MLSEIPEALELAVGAGADSLHGYTQPMPDALRSNAQVVWNEIT